MIIDERLLDIVSEQAKETPRLALFPKNRIVLNWTKSVDLVTKEELMRKSIYSESEIVKTVKELESGVSAEVVDRVHGLSKAILYQSNSKYSEMDVNRVRLLKELEEENRMLKQMYADLALDNRILRDVIEKNSRARGQEGVGMCHR